MKSEQTLGIVLSRTDYGEADRIVTVITPDKGKRRLMVKGARRMKSKMAGGIELFSVSELSYIKGRGDIDTLISARLDKYYSQIVNDIDRVQLGYELLKVLNRATEDEPEPDYFDLLKSALAALDNSQIETELIRLWFNAQLLRLAGHTPNLKTDTDGKALAAELKYNFDFEAMAFSQNPSGRYDSNQIKFIRLLFAGHQPAVINKVQGLDKLMSASTPLIQTMLQAHIRI